MNCEQVAPYLPGVAGGELGAATNRWVEAHIAGCESCRAESARYRTLATGLATLNEREIEPPAFLAQAIAERVRGERRHRFLPVPPIVSPEIARVVADNREAIVRFVARCALDPFDAHSERLTAWVVMSGLKGNEFFVPTTR
jgi:anti-sigma factor RsiW